MNDAVKVAGLCCSMLGFVVSLLLEERELAYACISAFGALLGFPVIGKGIQKLVK